MGRDDTAPARQSAPKRPHKRKGERRKAKCETGLGRLGLDESRPYTRPGSHFAFRLFVPSLPALVPPPLPLGPWEATVGARAVSYGGRPHPPSLQPTVACALTP